MTDRPLAAPAARTEAAPPPLRAPVLVLAFDRPDYLDRALASLRRQRGVALDPARVFLVQDGAVSARSGVRYAEDAAIAASVETFREHFPRGHVASHRANLGVAANTRRAEVLAFEALDSPLAYVFEDDLELGPEYLRTIESLAELAEADPRIAYFAAYGDHRAQPPGPEARLVPLDHHWGFGLTRAGWHRLRDWLAPFDAAVEAADYPVRDHLKIYDFLAGQPVATAFSSQDAVKAVGCAALGLARVMTDVCHARYLGERGASFHEAKFRDLGYDRMAWREGPEHRLAPDALSAVDGILAARRAEYEAFRRERFDDFLAEYRRHHFDRDRPLTRAEAETLFALLLDRVPRDEATFEGLVGQRTVRQLRDRLLSSREFLGRNPPLPE